MSSGINYLPPPWPNMAQALSKYAIELKEAQSEENRRSGGTDAAQRDDLSAAGDQSSAANNRSSGGENKNPNGRFSIRV